MTLKTSLFLVSHQPLVATNRRHVLPAVEKLPPPEYRSGGNRWSFQQTTDAQGSLQKITKISFWQEGHKFADILKSERCLSGSNKSRHLPREGELGVGVMAGWQGTVLTSKGTVPLCLRKESRTGPVTVARVSHSPEIPRQVPGDEVGLRSSWEVKSPCRALCSWIYYM